MAENFQSRKYQLTINNPIEKGLSHLEINKILSSMNINYYCLGDEQGNDTNTYHTHVFIYSQSPIRFQTLKNKFPPAHIEKAFGSVIDNKNYILKQGKWAESEKSETTIAGTFEEYGIMPSERAEKEPDMAQIISLFDDGMTVNEVIDMFPKYALRVNELESLYSIRREKNINSIRTVNVTYIYGETGTGKTFSIYKKYNYKDVCRITNYTNKGLFDGYKGQSVIVFEEYHSQIPLAQMLTYLDVYPVALPARYHDRVALYTEVFILSNIPYFKQYEYERTTDHSTWKAFERRIGKIYKQIGFDNAIEIEKGAIEIDERNPFTC